MSDFEFSRNAYVEEHNRSLLMGLKHDDFLIQKVQWTTKIIQKFGARTYLDFGFGTGDVLEGVMAKGAVRSVYGVEPSESLRNELIGRHSKNAALKIVQSLQDISSDSIDVMSCFNVLHHVQVELREEVSKEMVRTLRPGGTLLVWEHNPYNPMTQWIVCRCKYDDDAILLPKREVVTLFGDLRAVQEEYVNFAPPSLHRFSAIKNIESSLKKIPLGAQYRVLLRKQA